MNVYTHTHSFVNCEWSIPLINNYQKFQNLHFYYYLLVAMSLASEDALARFSRIGTKLIFLDDSGWTTWRQHVTGQQCLCFIYLVFAFLKFTKILRMKKFYNLYFAIFLHRESQKTWDIPISLRHICALINKQGLGLSIWWNSVSILYTIVLIEGPFILIIMSII